MEVTKYNKNLCCANCGHKIKATEEYFKCNSYLIQEQCFDDEKDNVFCSKDCFCDYFLLKKLFNGNRLV